MAPDEIKALRKELACTAKELAQALDLEQATVLAWEKGDLFPTKAYIERMEALRARGPSAIVRKSRSESPMKNLADPGLWELMRKLLVHKKLREDVLKLAASYPDPAADEKA